MNMRSFLWMLGEQLICNFLENLQESKEDVYGIVGPNIGDC